jgi:hypothetical protein
MKKKNEPFILHLSDGTSLSFFSEGIKGYQCWILTESLKLGRLEFLRPSILSYCDDEKFTTWDETTEENVKLHFRQQIDSFSRWLKQQTIRKTQKFIAKSEFISSHKLTGYRWTCLICHQQQLSVCFSYSSYRMNLRGLCMACVSEYMMYDLEFPEKSSADITLGYNRAMQLVRKKLEQNFVYEPFFALPQSTKWVNFIVHLSMLSLLMSLKRFQINVPKDVLKIIRRILIVF